MINLSPYSIDYLKKFLDINSRRSYVFTNPAFAINVIDDINIKIYNNYNYTDKLAANILLNNIMDININYIIDDPKLSYLYIMQYGFDYYNNDIYSMILSCLKSPKYAFCLYLSFSDHISQEDVINSVINSPKYSYYLVKYIPNIDIKKLSKTHSGSEYGNKIDKLIIERAMQ